MIVLDCHNHAEFSFDSKVPLQTVIDTAFNRGANIYAITEHCDVNSTDIDLLENTKNYLNAIKSVVKPDNFTLIKGIELGQPLQNHTLSKQLCALEDLDFVIGSMHNVDGYQDYYYLDFHELGLEQVTKITDLYYNEMLEMTLKADFDVLGHITYPLRYFHRRDFQMDFTRYDDIIREILINAITNSKGIEINSSTFRAFGEPLPSKKYVKLYHDLGGEILSIGADAHVEENILKDIDKATQLAIDVGFTHLTYFKNRKPNFVKIQN